jgi:hypothetical protein
VPPGLVKLKLQSVGAGIGGSSSEGVLSYQGKDYPFTVSGLNLADVGESNFEGADKVYDLKA